MRWFKKYSVESEKNGTITVYPGFRNPVVEAGEFNQSCKYMADLWKYGIQHLPIKKNVARVLMLGLGGGSGVRSIEQYFPEAQLSVIEWDEAMVTIAKDLQLWKREPVIHVGDICDIMPTLTQTFEVILVDVFYGDQPEPRLLEQKTVEDLSQLVAEDGYVVMNLSRKPEFIAALEHALTLENILHFRNNTLAIFSQKK